MRILCGMSKPLAAKETGSFIFMLHAPFPCPDSLLDSPWVGVSSWSGTRPTAFHLPGALG